jgi:small-conductance mechanosensitive channel
MSTSRAISRFQRPRIALLVPALLLLLILQAPVARGDTNGVADTRLQEIRVKMQDNQLLLDSETNLAIRAVAEKRQDLLRQDLANMERRLAIESREQALRSRQKTEPLAVLKVFLLSLKGDEQAAQTRAKSLDEQFRFHQLDRTRLNTRLNQLRANTQTDPRSIGDVESALRTQDEQITLCLLQRDLADWQILLQQEVTRLSDKIRVFEAGATPVVKGMFERIRNMREEEKKLGEIRQRLQGLIERREDVTAALELAKAKAAQLNEAADIRKERDRVEKSRQHLLAWMFTSNEEKEKQQEQAQINHQMAQAQAVEESLLTAGQVIELYEKELAVLRAGLAAWQKRFLESIMIPVACILAILVLHVILTRLILPLLYHRDRLFVVRRYTTYLGSLIILIVLIRFFLEDLKDIGTVLGIAGAAVVIALQDLCSSFAGWFVIVGSGKFKVGDRVEINDTRGDVIDIQLLRTTLNELNNWMGSDEPTGRIVVLPNSFIFKDKVTNYTHVHPFIWSRKDITVTFETPPKEARELLWKILTEETKAEFDAASTAKNLMEKTYGIPDATYEPKIVTSIDDSGVTFKLLYVTHYRRRRVTSTQLNERILDEFAKNPKLQFAYPTTRQIPTPESGGFHVTVDPSK